MAVMNAHLEIVEFLCRHRRECDVGAVIASTPLRGREEVAKILFKYHKPS
ncbi:hypothetical protein PybrP1_007743 [[Pythium] brassicae (nom. inval.)]|nr:hypothetical protein PybrP1_007743 [[Pythium] brassicae (nom. inval.)]